jgi:hypothetical protein
VRIAKSGKEAVRLEVVRHGVHFKYYLRVAAPKRWAGCENIGVVEVLVEPAVVFGRGTSERYSAANLFSHVMPDLFALSGVDNEVDIIPIFEFAVCAFRVRRVGFFLRIFFAGERESVSPSSTFGEYDVWS